MRNRRCQRAPCPRLIPDLAQLEEASDQSSVGADKSYQPWSLDRQLAALGQMIGGPSRTTHAHTDCRTTQGPGDLGHMHANTRPIGRALLRAKASCGSRQSLSEHGALTIWHGPHSHLHTHTHTQTQRHTSLYTEHWKAQLSMPLHT